MRKGFFGICLSLVVAIVLLAAFLPSCGPVTPTTGTIVVKATLCGIPWPAQGTGAVNYTLTPTGGAPVGGTAVPTTHTNMTPTTWTCAHVSGFPPGAFLNSIQPSASQSLVAGGTITFTFDFELDQDAAIDFWAWSQNGVAFQGPISEIVAVPCQVIDAHFKQWVNGCEGYNVTMNETSLLNMQWTNYQGGAPGAAGVTIYVIDDWCAVNKTPAPREKVSQVPSFNRTPVGKGMWFEWPGIGQNVTLDVETTWKLAKATNYTKAINWFGISRQWDEGGWHPHPCVLFEFVFQAPGTYTFQMATFAEVKLVGATDVNPVNNKTMSPPVTLTVNVPA